MAVVKVYHNVFGDSSSAKLNSDGVVEYTETQHWIVQYETAAEFSPVLAQYASDGVTSIPAVGSPYLLTMFCQTIEGRRDETSPNFCNVMVTYTTRPDQEKWRIEVSSKGIPYTEDVHQDRDSNAIVNSAGQNFDPYEKKTYYDEEICVSYNTLPEHFDPDAFEDIRGKINSDSVTMTIYGVARTFAAGTLICRNADYRTSIGSGTRFFSVSLVLHYRSIGWQHQIVDRGWEELQDDGTLTPIMRKDSDGNPTGEVKTTISYLDGSGKELAIADPSSPPSVTLLLYDIEDETDFSTVLGSISN